MGHESDLGYLLYFLQRELERRERSQTFAMECVTSKADITVDTRPMSTVSALHTSTNKHAYACVVCGRSGHTLDRCYCITNIVVTKRRGVLRGVKACFRCLRCVKGHSFRDCRAVCNLCKGGHHQLLCDNVDQVHRGGCVGDVDRVGQVDRGVRVDEADRDGRVDEVDRGGHVDDVDLGGRVD